LGGYRERSNRRIPSILNIRMKQMASNKIGLIALPILLAGLLGLTVWGFINPDPAQADLPDPAASSPLAGALIPLLAASEVVTSSADSGPGSLRAALAAVADGGSITFDAALAGQTITLSSPLSVTQSVTVAGGHNITLSGGDAVRLFFINGPAGTLVRLKQLTLSDGLAQGPNGAFPGGGGAAGMGGAVFVNSGNSLAAEHVTFSDNHAQGGNGGATGGGGSFLISPGSDGGQGGDAGFGSGGGGAGGLNASSWWRQWRRRRRRRPIVSLSFSAL
jgi:hypothetical protein